MDARQLFFRNLSSAIAKRFDTPFAATSRPKKEVVADLVKKHFSLKKDETESMMITDCRKKLGSAVESVDDAVPASEVMAAHKRITQKREVELEQKIKKTVEPQVEEKRKTAEILLKKIEILEKNMKETSMPKNDRARLESLIADKKKELMSLRASVFDD